MRAAGNYCTCPTPCVQDAYVPTTSFSVVLHGTTNTQDAATSALQEKVYRARETSYRVVRENYAATMRSFHVILQQLSRMLRFSRAAQEEVEHQFRSVSRHVVMVKADCIWVRDMLLEVKVNITEFISKPIAEFRSIMLTRVEESWQELESLISDASSEVSYYRSRPSPAWREDLESYISVSNSSLWQTYSSVIAPLHRLSEGLATDIYHSVNSLPSTDQLRLQLDTFQPILANIGNTCSWCYVSEDTPLLVLLKEKTRDRVNSLSLRNRLRDARNKLTRAYVPYLLNLNFANASGDVTPQADRLFRDVMFKIGKKIHDANTDIQLALDYAGDVVALVDNLIAYTWDYKCQTELPKLHNEYSGNHRMTEDLIREMYIYVEAENATLHKLKEDYVTGRRTLMNVGNTIRYDDLVDVVNGKKLRLDSTLKDRILLVDNLERQINQIYYVLVSMVTTDHISGLSPYWQDFGIISPKLIPPTIMTVGGVRVPLPDFHIVPEVSSSAQTHWRRLADILTFMRESLEMQVVSLDRAVTTSKDYTAGYIQGSRLTEDFYR